MAAAAAAAADGAAAVGARSTARAVHSMDEKPDTGRTDADAAVGRPPTLCHFRR